MNNPGLNWGATSAERAAPLPCDALLTTAATHADRAISIEAPPELVFAWLCQLRRAPYSYDIIDNRGRRSPRTLDPAMTHLEPAVRPAPVGKPAGTRLHVRVRFSGSRVIAAALACADLVMMRKQLLTLAELAERDSARAHPGPAAAPT